jgi:hypothetical protein
MSNACSCAFFFFHLKLVAKYSKATSTTLLFKNISENICSICQDITVARDREDKGEREEDWDSSQESRENG